MARRRSQGSGSFLALFLAIVALVFLVPTSTASDVAQPSSDKPDLICHTDNADECYPKVFEAKEYFQFVKEDQDLPPGLHVRMDIYSGRTEAKLMDPSEENPALKDAHTESEVLVVEPEAQAESNDEPVMPDKAPIYEAFGVVKPPQEESPAFYANLDYVRKGPGGTVLDFDEALEFLEEISHDVYYGRKIAENPETVKALLCLMTEIEHGTRPDGVKPQGQQAAAILAGALRNNPKAIEDVGSAWLGFMESTCPHDSSSQLRNDLYSLFAPQQDLAETNVVERAAITKAHVSALASLLRDPAIRDDFLKNKGMDKLVQTLIPNFKAWDGVQTKVGNLLVDNFLDEGLGATKGDWPLFRAAETDVVKRKSAREADEVWLKAVSEVKERNKRDSGHWSVEVLKELEKLHDAQIKALPKEDL